MPHQYLRPDAARCGRVRPRWPTRREEDGPEEEPRRRVPIRGRLRRRHPPEDALWTEREAADVPPPSSRVPARPFARPAGEQLLTQITCKLIYTMPFFLWGAPPSRFSSAELSRPVNRHMPLPSDATGAVAASPRSRLRSRDAD